MSKDHIIKEMYYFYIENHPTHLQNEEFISDFIKKMFNECVEPNVYIKEPEKYTILQNGFSPNNNDLDLN